MDLLAPVSRLLAHPAWALRDGSPRLRYLREFSHTQWLDPERVQDQVKLNLRRLLAHAIARCPHYRSRAAELGIRAEDIRGPSDLSQWPILDKRHIQEHGPELVAEGWHEDDLVPDFTGGSTGAPLRFFLHSDRVASRAAGAWRHDGWAGWRPGDRKGLLWGAPRDFLPQDNWRARVRSALLDRTLQLDATCLTQESMERYWRRLLRFRPPVLQAYAQSMVVFAGFLRERDLEPPRLRGIITSAEVLTPDGRQLIESVFGCRVYDRYGSREVGLIASQCSEGEWMHVNAESVLVEFVQGNRPASPGELGEVLVTDLRNYAMPLIRYRIGDLGSPMAGACACGRGLPLMRMVAGRVTDSIVRPDGGLVSGISLATYMITGRPGIGQVQLHQYDTQSLVVRVVPGPGFSSADTDCLRERAQSYLGHAITIRFDTVASIPKEASGKYRFSISEVSGVDAMASRSRRTVSAALSEARDE